MLSIRVDSLLAEANELVDRGELDRADHLLQEILLHDSYVAAALTLAGVIAHRKGRSEIALELMKKALAINPDDAVAYVTCGQAYRALGHLTAAEASLRNALRLEPNRHDAHLNLALTLWSAGEHARAGTYFKNVLLLSKQSFQAYFYLGQIHQENAELRQAEECFRNAAALQAKHVDVRLMLGRLLLSQGRIAEASSELEHSVVANPAERKLRVAAAGAAFELANESCALEHLKHTYSGAGSDSAGDNNHAMRGRLREFDVWCKEQNAEQVRVARQQRHKVRAAKVYPSGVQGFDVPELITPDVFVAELKNCRVLPGDHLLCAQDNSVCIAGVMTRPLHRPFTSPHIIHSSDDGRLLLEVPERQLRVEAPCLYIGAANDYFDWVFDCITRLWAYQQRPVCKELPLLVQTGLTRWHYELLMLLGYGEARLIKIANDSLAHCDGLFVASLSAPLNFVAPFALEHLRRKIRMTVATKADGPRRIFLTRQNLSKRKLANFQEIGPILDRYGFYAVPAESLRLREVIEMIQGADIVLGMEGAAMANVFMAPAHARIAMLTAEEVQDDRYYGPSCALGQEFAFLQCQPVFESNPRLADCDLRLDPEIMEEYLSKLQAG